MERLRFKDENGNEFPKWEYIKLCKFGKGYTGISGLNKDYFNTTKDNAMYITYMDVFSKSAIREPNGTFLNENGKQNVVKHGDILFTTSSETRDEVGIASVYLGKKPTYLNSFCFGWTSDEKRDHYFMSYLLNSNSVRRKIIRLGQGSTRYNISKNKLLDIPMEMPTYKEQEKIGGFLSAFDRLIEKQRDKVDLLKKYKYKYTEILLDINLKFDNQPNNLYATWENGKLGKYINCFSGGTPSSTNSNYYNGEIPFIRSSEIDKTDTKLFISESGFKNSSAKMVREGDLLFAMYGATSGKTAISKISGAINQAVLAIRSSEFNHYFLHIYFQHNRKKLVTKYTQGGQPNLSSKIIKNMKVPKPNLVEQEKIGGFLSAFDRLIQKEEKTIKKYESMKKSYLQRLFYSG